MLVCDDRLPVSLFLSMSMRDINSKTPTRFAKVMLRALPPETRAKIRGRHAAITTNFNNWRSYKEWAEKMRHTWKEEK
jgi:hypothetical protein